MQEAGRPALSSGSERHEARRIDNQLRGRAARQGDPGSSRFYLSLEDDLMRCSAASRSSSHDGAPAASTMPSRSRSRLVSNIIEQSQHRVEGANFDVRKHLLEYDDVLNKQRTRSTPSATASSSRKTCARTCRRCWSRRSQSASKPAWQTRKAPGGCSPGSNRSSHLRHEAGRALPLLYPAPDPRRIINAQPTQTSATAILTDRHALEIEHGNLQRAIETMIDRADRSP